tara:strand:- start:153297 stop:153935 length:639 start_codon:yes stop_codon:yes gene_type:complete
MKNRLAIIGSGHLGQLIAGHAESCGYHVVGFFDDWTKKGKLVNGLPVYGVTAEIEQCFKEGVFDCLMVGVGYQHFGMRKQFFETFEALRIPFATMVHKSCYVDKGSEVGEGSILLPGCTIDIGVTIGKNVLLNTSCTIAHDTTIGSHSFLSPRVALAGFIKIGECSMLGINSTVIDNITICAKTKVGGGAVVVKNIVTPGLYVGVPAKLKIK